MYGGVTTINGMRLYETPVLTVPGEPYERRRTWKERLFHLPFRPWRATETVIPEVPDPNCIVSKEMNAILAHPETAAKLRSKLDDK